jgi:hypothetical protein
MARAEWFLSKKAAPRRRSRPGLSLLELMLALGLTGVVMVVISIAIDLHLRTLERGRTDVERAQLARAVLRHIARDLQNTVWYEPIDLSGVQNLAITSEAGDLLDAVDSIEDAAGDTGGGGGARDEPGASDGGLESGLDGLGGGDAASDDLLGGSDLLGSEDLLGSADLLGDAGLTDELGLTENTMDIAGTLQPASVPGLYGNQYELQVDISRLPRVDQYTANATEAADSQVIDVPSDVKSVAYFLQTSDEADPDAVLSGAAVSGVAGLARREQDRAIASWAADDGGLETADHSGSLLAPEVNYLEFRYFDGIDWYTEWDSEQMESLPVAVEITIGIDPAFGEDPATLDAGVIADMAAAEQAQELYRMVVHLPAARPAELEEISEMDLMGDLGL